MTRTSVGNQVRIFVKNLTAAYSIDPDCAEVEVVDGSLLITGKHICTTHMVAVTSEGVSDFQVVITARRNHVDDFKSPSGGEGSGSLATYYTSDPGEVTSFVNLFRRDGDRSTSLDFSVAHGYAFSRTDQRTAIPFAALTFAGPSSRLTLLDSRVEQSPLVFQDSNVRGIHLESATWLLHAGFNSPVNFQRRVMDDESDVVFSLGRRIAISEHSSLIPGVEWIAASSRYISGSSGGLGSLEYRYDSTKGFELRSQVAGGPDGVGGFVAMTLDRSSDTVHFTARATPSRFPSLSTASLRGVQADSSWEHRFSDRFSFDAVGSRNTYFLFAGTNQTNITGTGTLQFHPNQSWNLSAGIAGSSLARPGSSAIRSRSLPFGIGYESLHFGDAFQYQFRTNSATERGSHAMRDSVRLSVRPFVLTAYASRQTQAPTVDFVLSDLPGVREAMFAEGFFATTPEQVAQFIAAHAGLIATGQLRDLTINVAPVRDQAGATLSWNMLRNRVTTRLESRWDSNNGVLRRQTISSYDGRVSVRLTPRTEMLFSGTVFSTRAASLHSGQTQAFTVGLRRQLDSVPDFLRPRQASVIRGRVYSDAGANSTIPQQGIAGVPVLLDGTRRSTTNKNGQFVFSSVSEGRHSVEVLYPATEAEVFTTPPYVEVSEGATVDFGIGERKTAVFGVVRSDAYRGIPGVAVHLAGPDVREIRTDSSGAFAVMDLTPGTYEVSINADSLPPSYALTEIARKQVSALLAQPAEAQFEIRALRSISGRVVCGAATVEAASVELLVNNKTKAIVLGQGRFVFRDLPSGDVTLAVDTGERQVVRVISLTSEPTQLGDITIQVCGDSK